VVLGRFNMSDIVVMVSKCGTEHHTDWKSLESRSDHFIRMRESGMVESTTNRIVVDASAIAVRASVNWIATGLLPRVGLRFDAELAILVEL